MSSSHGRRTFLSTAVGSAALASLLRAEESKPAPVAKAKRIIYLFQSGGPSHLDMYDLKPNAPKEFRGEEVALFRLLAQVAGGWVHHDSEGGLRFISRDQWLRVHAAWKRYGLKFPVNPEIILVHGLKGFIITEDHCALLFRRGKGYTYIEKMGPTSPFVRLDVETRADVLAWLGAQHFGSDTFSRTFATFNDTVIEEISPPKP
jgi:hypothetical protein